MVYSGFRDARLDIPDPPPAQLAMSVAEAVEAGFLPALDEDHAYILSRRSCSCTETLRTTDY